jgi:glycosyltransferase involved in cell wall biosynthesis
VAFLIGSFRYGGAERDLLELLRRLDRSRYEFHVLYVERQGDLLPQIEGTGAALHPLGIHSLTSLKGIRAVRRTRAYLREHGVRILNGFGVYGSFYAAVIARGIPELKVISYEFTPVPPPRLRARLFQPWYYRRADVIVGNSDAVLKAVGSRRGVAGGKLVKIYNGVDASTYTPSPADPANGIPGVPEGAAVVGVVGRLNPIKGHTYIVAAWPEVAKRFPEARLVLVGPSRPADLERLQAEARRTGRADRIVFLGQRGDVPRLLPLMDVVAVPSLTEGFSNVVIEAGAAGRPVVATRVGGNPEAIVEGETGLLVPARDPGALAGAILSLLGDPERGRRMGEAARRRIASLYTVERMVDGYDRLYRSLLDGERA